MNYFFTSIITIMMFANTGVSLYAEEASKASIVTPRQNWEVSKQKHGITVYTRETKESSIKEFRAVTKVKASLKSLTALINDPKAGTSLYFQCSKVKALKQKGPTTSYIYSVMDMPWPLSDRDFIAYRTLTQNKKNNAVTLKFKGIPNYMPSKPGMVRMAKLKGYWRLTPGKKGFVNVVYQSIAEPGGSVPDWVVNMFIVDGPYKTLLNLKKLVKQAQYKNTNINYITE